MKEFHIAAAVPVAIVEEAWQEVEQLRALLPDGRHRHSGRHDGEDTARLCGPRYGRAEGKAGHRWGKTKGKVGFHGGKIGSNALVCAPVTAARSPTELETVMSETSRQVALNLMLINVSTRRFGRPSGCRKATFRPPRAPRVQVGVSRRFVALSRLAWRIDDGRPVRAGPADHPDRRHPHRRTSRCWPPSAST